MVKKLILPTLAIALSCSSLLANVIDVEIDQGDAPKNVRVSLVYGPNRVAYSDLTHLARGHTHLSLDPAALLSHRRHTLLQIQVDVQKDPTVPMTFDFRTFDVILPPYRESVYHMDYFQGEASLRSFRITLRDSVAAGGLTAVLDNVVYDRSEEKTNKEIR